MRVVQFLGSKGWGGLENVFVTLCNELSKTVKTDVIIFKESAVEKKFDKTIRVHLLFSNPSRFNPALYIELYFLIRKLQVDIVHTHGAKTTQIFYYLNKLFHIPHIATKHNARRGKIFNKIPNIIAVSKGVAQSVSTDNVKIIYNGINPIEVFPQKQDKIFTILAIGRLDKIKGFDILIKECQKLDFTFKLNIIGEGKERNNLENLIHELDLNEKINLLGFRNDIPQLMKNSDLVVASSHSEGFSVVMVESMFYADLFISTKVSGATEVLDDMFLIDDHDISSKLKDIYKNYKVYAEEFSKLKQKSSSKFLLEHVVNEHIRYYRSILRH